MQDHGQPVFTGSSGRVFPQVMKASPLLRHWLADLTARGLDLRTRWRFDGVGFDTPEGRVTVDAKAVVLALGGASWARLGSDGQWARWLDVPLAPFQPANMGFLVDWSPHMAQHFGQPLKGVALIAGTQRVRAEAVISARGLEGGGIYAISRALREGAGLAVDLFPDVEMSPLAARLGARVAVRDLLERHLDAPAALAPGAPGT